MSTMGYVATLPSAGDAAALNLDFRNQSYKVNGANRAFNDLFTFARGTTAGRWNKNGKYEIVAANVPRFDYDPLTKVLKGILFEDARTNLHTYSEDFNDSAWNKGVGTCKVSSDVTSPIGVAHKFVESTAAGPHFLQRSFVPIAGSNYTSFRVLKAGERTDVRAQIYTTTAITQATFNLATGVAAGTGAAMTALGDGWYLCTMTGLLPTAVSTSDRWYPANAGVTSYTGDGVSGYYVACAQLEQGAFNTSYIPTPTSFASRASTATYFDSNGVLRTAGVNVARIDYNPVTKVSNGLLIEGSATNYLTNSTSLNGATWANVLTNAAQIIVGEKKAVAPDGTMTALRLDFSTKAAGDVQLRRQTLTSLPINSTLIASIWVRSDTPTVIRLRDGNTSTLTELPVTSTWTRVSGKPGLNTTSNFNFDFSLALNSTAAATVYFWGAQLEVGSTASSYIPTTSTFVSRTTSGSYYDANGILQIAPAQTSRFDYDPASKLSRGLLFETARTNSLIYSDNIQSVLWTVVGGTVTPNKMLAPDGTMTAARFTENTSSSVETHGIDKPSASGTQLAGSTYTISAFFKSGERSRVRLVGLISSTSQTGAGYFDLATGTVIGIDATGVSDPEITSVGNGWYRCSIVLTITAGSSAVTPRGYFQSVQSGNVAVYLGDGVSGLYIWGPQLESGNSVTSYIPTATVFTSRASTATYFDSTGLLQTAASGVARNAAYMYDENNVLKPVGLLIERNAATNLVTRSTEYTNTAWTKGAGISLSTDGSLAPDGSIAQKFTLSGSTSHDMSTPVSALVAGTTYTLSLWMKNIGAVVPSFQLAYYDAGVSVVAGSIGTAVQVIGQWKRYSTTFVCPATTVAAPRVRLIGFSGGLDGNAFYLWNCQLEAGTYATSDIITTGAEATRAVEISSSVATVRQADVVTNATVTRAADLSTSSAVSRAAEDLTTKNLTGWYNSTEGTLVSEFVQEVPLIVSSFRRPVALVGAGLYDQIGFYLNGSTGNMQGFVFNTTSQMDVSSGAATYKAGEVRRAALGYKLNDSAFSSKGAIATDTAVTLPTIVALNIGSSNNGTNRWNGYVRSVNYYPRRMNNVELPLIGA